MYADPSGHMPEWGWWVLGGLVVVGLFAATVFFAGGFAAAGVAIYSAGCGIAYGSAATTVASFAFVGSVAVYGGALAYNGLNIATAELRGSTYETAFNDMMAMGDDVFFATITSGFTSGIGGYASYNDQLKGLGHSWTTERRNYLKQNPEAKGKVLHHPYGRYGANARIYYPVSVDEHKAIHHELGYGNGKGGFYQYREWFNWWKDIYLLF